MKHLFALALLFLAGCACYRSEIPQQAARLKEAGFETAKIDAPRLSTLSRTKMVCQSGRASDGTVIYQFVDPISGVSYLGSPDHMATYKELTAQYRAHRTAELASIDPHPSCIPDGMIDQPTSWWWYPWW